ncbi:hypothetical protein OG552_17290 [Streptomyces sp. NBC_01476]|uniref:hypothetical protein n=1 Tax=Streptomyces sp. NBC_01476 TaxID=2903881 RepID=UPI002E2F66A8|nr:hypothetical protein [Streptomyces sp. NBC_01476]
MDEERRLAVLAPEMSRTTVDLLRRVVGVEPAERIPAEALATADRVLAQHGADGLRLLTMGLCGWAAVLIEQDAKMSGRTYEAVLDDIDLTCIESHAEN